MTVDDSVLTSSSVPENDYPAWASGTTYAAGDRVILASTHIVYQSVLAANTGNNPATDDGTNWVAVGSTNRWRAFNGKLSDQVSNPGSIEYVLVLSELVYGIAFFGLEASSVQVQVVDDASAEVFTETKAVIDNTFVVDWLSWVDEPVAYDSEALFMWVQGRFGFTVTITIDAGAGTAKVGQIVLGKIYSLGTVTENTAVGFKDYSTKETDDFGNLNIVPRAYSRTVEFNFAFNTKDARRILRILSSLRATPAVYFMDEDTSDFATTVYGAFPNFEAPLNAGDVSYSSIKVEGLV
jgi:hypothetical protein